MVFYLLLFMLSPFLSSLGMEQNSGNLFAAFFAPLRTVTAQDIQNSQHKDWTDQRLYYQIQFAKDILQHFIGSDREKNVLITRKFDELIVPYQTELFSRNKPYIPKINWIEKDSTIAYASYKLLPEPSNS
jgi:hypothetical protein